jgi:hypothetical protein
MLYEIIYFYLPPKCVYQVYFYFMTTRCNSTWVDLVCERIAVLYCTLYVEWSAVKLYIEFHIVLFPHKSLSMHWLNTMATTDDSPLNYDCKLLFPHINEQQTHTMTLFTIAMIQCLEIIRELTHASYSRTDNIMHYVFVVNVICRKYPLIQST